MRTFLGVPILMRGVAYGNLYLTEKPDGGDSRDEDEELVTLLAAQAAVAIENARLYESATRWLAPARVADRDRRTRSSARLELPRLLDLIAAGCASCSARGSSRSRSRRRRGDLGSRPPTASTASERRGVRSCPSSSKTRPRARAAADRARRLGPRRSRGRPGDRAAGSGSRPGSSCRCSSRDRAIGVDGGARQRGADPRFTDDDVRLAEAFAARAAVAADLSERVARDALRRVVVGAGARAPAPRARAARRDRPGAARRSCSA